MFYTNVLLRGDKIYVRGYDNNTRIKDIVNYNPYFFIKKDNGNYKTIDGARVEKLSFDSVSEAKDFVKQYENMSNINIYGSTNFSYVYIYDKFPGEIQYDVSKIKVGNLDIECDSSGNFPNIEKADKAITAITIRCNGKNYVFGLKKYIAKDEDTLYFLCKDEYELIQKFLKCWEYLDLDVVTGWNIEFFDIPYIVNRIAVLFNMNEAKKLSPWRIIAEKKIEFRGKENQSYDILGISTLDYYQLYRKFSFGNQESYKLDYIAQIEIGENKVDYHDQGYEDLNDLYEKNFQLFIDYNIKDSVLVDKLEEKLKFIEQVVALAYFYKVNYNDTLTTIRAWDVLIHNFLLDRRIVVPQITRASDSDSIVGGFVKEPKIGLSKWVVSFDLTSLYPSLIQGYNISPDTKLGKYENFPSVDDLLEKSYNFEYSTAANGCYYSKEKQGFLAALMEKMFNERITYKSKMLEAKKRYEVTKSKEDENLAARYHNMQMALKIALNSGYGAIANKYFRWFDNDNAEAITMSGQLTIRFIGNKLNEFFNKTLKTKDIDYIIASDTDSVYINMEPMVNMLGHMDEKLIVDVIDKFCNQKIQPYLDNCFEELAENMNVFKQKMQMKRETIANKGIWKAKKMYILNAWNVEGVQYEKPKLKIQGIEAVRSSTPHICREKIKEALSIIMNEDEVTLQKFIEKFQQEFVLLPFEEVAFPRGVKGLKEYSNKETIYNKATPIHVKGALIYNDFIKKNKLNKYTLIEDGDKIRFCYLKQPNPIQDSVIACLDVLPKEFGLENYIDVEKQFNKCFVEPIRSITEVIGWNTEKISNLEDFFS